MVEDEGQKEEEKFELTPEREVLGYISLDQARLLTMQAAKGSPGEYGRRFQGDTVALEVVDVSDQEDSYTVTLSFRPQGEFARTPGHEQFFIKKERVVAHRPGVQGDVVARWPAKGAQHGFPPPFVLAAPTYPSVCRSGSKPTPIHFD